ncbi:MAG: desulfoferrodoxin family protein [bacterium]
MTLKMEIFKCSVCGNIAEIIHSGEGELVCCNEKMVKSEPKDKEEGTEKHLPTIKENDDLFLIQVGETEHPMTAEHHIEWIEAVTEESTIRKFLKPGEKPRMTLNKKYRIKLVRAYCNIHGLWRKPNINEFNREDVILFAIKSERSAMTVYSTLAKRVKNAILKERLTFLAGEEEKHEAYFEELYKMTYLNKNIVIPPDDIIPTPRIDVKDENKNISEVLSSAMDAELAANEFYLDAAVKFTDMPKTAKMLKFFASMEMIHYAILSVEKKNAEIFESYEFEVPMIHVGP